MNPPNTDENLQDREPESRSCRLSPPADSPPLLVEWPEPATDATQERKHE